MIRFNPGQVVATPGAIRLMEETGTLPLVLLRRHLELEQGTLDNEDHATNKRALRDGSRILSSFRLGVTNPETGEIEGEKIWLITEAVGDSGKRESTTILLPSDY